MDFSSLSFDSTARNEATVIQDPVLATNAVSKESTRLPTSYFFFQALHLVILPFFKKVLGHVCLVEIPFHEFC